MAIREAVCIALITAFCSTTASAAPMAWNWDAPKQFYIESDVHLAESLRLLAERNTHLDLERVQVDLLTTCAPEHESKKAWTLSCSVDDIAVRAAPMFGTQNAWLEPVLQELDDKLGEARIEVVMAKTGRVRHVDIVGLATGREREAYIDLMASQILERSMAGLDLELPTKTPDAKTWKQKQNLAAKMPTPDSTGTIGMMRTIHQQVENGDTVQISTQADGHIAPAMTMDAMGGTAVYETIMNGEAIFDTETGTLTQRSWHIEGTPSSTLTISNSRRYVHSLQLSVVEPNAPAPKLGMTAAIGENIQ